jgi:hypothetical protein
MSTITLRATLIALLGTTLLGGCSGGLADLGFGGSPSATTASIPEVVKVDPACATLVSQIDGLKKDGVADKVAQAAAKKYKMNAADLGKADQLNKANGEFQAKCAVGPKPAQTAAAMVAPAMSQAAAPAASKAVAAATTAAASAVPNGVATQAAAAVAGAAKAQ